MSRSSIVRVMVLVLVAGSCLVAARVFDKQRVADASAGLAQPRAGVGVAAPGGAAAPVALPGQPLATACGPAWRTVSTPDPPGSVEMFRAIAPVTTSDIWAVGAAGGMRNSMAAHWNGTSWTTNSPPPVGFDAYLYGAAAAASNDVWAVGTYRDAASLTFHTLAQHWNGTAWSTVSTPNVGANHNYLNAVVAVSSSNVWAVGYTEDGPSITSLILHYNGTSWSIVSSPNPAASGNYLYGVAATSANDIWAVGYAYDASAMNVQTLTLRYNGSSWSTVPSPNIAPGAANLLLAVSAVSPTLAFAVGHANAPDGHHTLIMQWNGSAWSLATSPDSGGQLYAVAAESSGDVWAIGVDGKGDGLIEHYDGTTWTSIPRVGSLNDSAVLQGIFALPTGNLWLAGYSSINEGKTQKTLADRLCEIVLNDTGFGVAKTTVSMGETAVWTLGRNNAQSHSITDGYNMGLFDSGLRGAGTSYVFTFKGAGSFWAKDVASSASMKIDVPLTVTPKSGGVTTQFTVTWSSAPVAGYVWDVQILRPGSTQWESWKAGVSTTTAKFTPDAGTGQYKFRARMKNASSGKMSGFCPAQGIIVS
jgi:hypothetical protein